MGPLNMSSQNRSPGDDQDEDDSALVTISENRPLLTEDGGVQEGQEQR